MSALVNLEEIDVNGNASLSTIHAQIFHLEKLDTTNCVNCRSMVSPPYAVCKQGLTAIKKYLADPEGVGVRFFPVTVIGESMAGKTSLVRSIQNNRRVLTSRSSHSKLDEATKVFKIQEVDVNVKDKLSFHDFGGQAIYQFANQLTQMTQFVPILVIDIAEFDRLLLEQGAEAACDAVCFNWLSNLYLSCPQTGPPLVVLTHCDRLSAKLHESRWTQLVEMTEVLRMRVINEEKVMAPDSSSLFSMTSFCDLSQPLLCRHKPIFISKHSEPGIISDLKSSIVSIGSSLLTEVPSWWYYVMQWCAERTEQPFLTLDELDNIFPDDKDHGIIQYLREIGRILWYRYEPKLAHIVFHRIELLTHLVGVLYDHTHMTAWQQRLNLFVPFRSGSHSINKRKYESMVNDFCTTGIMNCILLFHLIETESQLPSDLAIEVLKAFHLVCGPISMGDARHYILPYFSQQLITVRDTGVYIPHKVEMCFNGLAIPGYIYHLLTAIYVDLHVTDFNHVEVGSNGACVTESNGTVKYFFHDSIQRTVTFLILSQPQTISNAWESMLTTLGRLKSSITELWKGAHFDTVFYCSHCLLTKQAAPNCKINPEWVNKSGLPYTGKESFVCSQHSPAAGLSSVPYPLLYPCESI